MASQLDTLDLDELTCRRASFREGPRLLLRNGQEWTLTPPRAMIVPAPQGASVPMVAALRFDADVDPDGSATIHFAMIIDQMARLWSDWGWQDRLGAVTDLAVLALRASYDLSADQAYALIEPLEAASVLATALLNHASDVCDEWVAASERTLTSPALN